MTLFDQISEDIKSVMKDATRCVWSHKYEGDGKGNGHSQQAVGRKG